LAPKNGVFRSIYGLPELNAEACNLMTLLMLPSDMPLSDHSLALLALSFRPVAVACT